MWSDGKCAMCQERDAEAGYEKCTPCLFKDAAPEVRWLLAELETIKQSVNRNTHKLQEIRKGMK